MPTGSPSGVKPQGTEMAGKREVYLRLLRDVAAAPPRMDPTGDQATLKSQQATVLVVRRANTWYIADMWATPKGP